MNVLPSRNFGGEFGNSLAQGLQQLAQHKINENLQHRQRQEASRLWKSLGVPDKEAYAFASAPESVQKSLLDRLEGASFGGQPQNQYNQGQQGQQQQAQQMQPSLDQQGQPMGNGDQGGFTLGPTKEERRHREIIGAKEQAAVNKTVHPFIKETQSKARAAQENDIRLNRMRELINTGKLNNPQFAGLLKTLKKGVFGLGVDLSGLLTKEGQEFEKLTNDFTKSVKDIFGSNVTNLDLETFLSTIPHLAQSNEGKMSVINNLQLLNKGSELRNKASRLLIQKYGNKLPIDFESQVDDLIKPELDAISSEFKKGFSGKVAKTQPFVTDVVGGFGDILFGQS